MHSTLDRDQLHLSVDGLILTVRDGKLTVMLAQRSHPPCEGAWALPGRLVGLTESTEEAAQQLIGEMLPGVSAYSEQLYTFTAPGRDPRGRVVSVAYLILLPWEALEPALHQPVVPLRCFEPVQAPEGLMLLGGPDFALSPDALAFDHGLILRTGVSRLQGKISYTDVGFHLLRDKSAFSLSELQTIFEAVLNQSLDDSNFRRSIFARYEASGRITQTDQSKKQRRGRPAALYCFHE